MTTKTNDIRKQIEELKEPMLKNKPEFSMENYNVIRNETDKFIHNSALNQALNLIPPNHVLVKENVLNDIEMRATRKNRACSNKKYLLWDLEFIEEKLKALKASEKVKA